MRMHSAMHLLCAAVGCPVTGGQVGEAKSRLDFDLEGRTVDKDQIAALIARWIAENLPIRQS
jgi:misacylated tRNA(Ala) deacylase